MAKDGVLKLKGKNGKDKEYIVLASFRFNGNFFVIYTEYKKDEEKKIKVFASIYNPDNELNKIEKIKNAKEKDFIKQYIKKLEQDLKLKMKLYNNIDI